MPLYTAVSRKKGEKKCVLGTPGPPVVPLAVEMNNPTALLLYK